MRAPPKPDLRSHLVGLLEGGWAHVSLEEGLRGLPYELCGKRPRGAEHTLWELIEHIRIAQHDILEYSRNPAHESPAFPAGYWPGTAGPVPTAALARSRRAVLDDLAAMIELVRDPAHDLLTPLAHAPQHTLLREVLVLADHNAYHLGQVVALRRRLGAWRGV